MLARLLPRALPASVRSLYRATPAALAGEGAAPTPPAEEGMSVLPSAPAAEPAAPVDVTFGRISAAAFRIRSGVQPTPISFSPKLSELVGGSVFLKHEYLHEVAGSFKTRGARNALLLLDKAQQEAGCICASAGNHALALAHNARSLGIPCTVVMPTVAPFTKQQNCRLLGAKVIVQGRHIGESRLVANDIVAETGAVYINGFDDPAVIAGAGTMGLEIMHEVPDVDVVIVPVGGGGLIAGTARAIKTLKPSVEIVGVEPAVLPKASAARAAGKPVELPPASTLADGLLVTELGTNAFAMMETDVDRIVAVQEKSISLAMLRMLEWHKCVVEGGGVAGVAALVEDVLGDLSGKTVVIPLCGGNVDTPMLGRVLERGLAADGRLFKLSVTVTDRPGGVARLTQHIAKWASIKEIVHERSFREHPVSDVVVALSLEVTAAADGHKLLEELEEAGYTKVEHNLRPL